MNNDSPKPVTGPLNRTIQERQKEAAAREAAAKRSTIEYLVAPPAPPKAAPPQRPTIPAKPVSAEPQPIDYKKVATQTLDVVKNKTGWRRRELQFAGLILIGLLGLIGAMGALIVSGHMPQAPTPTATSVPLPYATVSDVLAYMKKDGVPIDEVQALKVPDNVWQAKQGARFTVQSTDGSSTFLLLSYETTSRAGQDASRVKLAALYSQWTATQVSNILLLAAPGSPQAMVTMLVAELNNELVVADHRSGSSSASH